jgi:hypothetical protein
MTIDCGWPPHERRESSSDDFAVIDTLEGQRVTFGALDAKGVVHSADGHDADIEFVMPPRGRRECARPCIDSDHLGAHEPVPVVRHEARARQAQIDRSLYAGNELVQVGQPFERSRPIEDRHGVFATEILRGRQASEVCADDSDAGMLAGLRRNTGTHK